MRSPSVGQRLDFRGELPSGDARAVASRAPSGAAVAAIGSMLGAVLAGGAAAALHGFADDSALPLVQTAAAATLLRPGDAPRALLVGDRLHVGDVVAPGSDGKVAIGLAGGRVVVGESARVRVASPLRWEVLHGSAGIVHNAIATSAVRARPAALTSFAVPVDNAGPPAPVLVTGGVVIAAAPGSAVRVEHDPQVQVAALRGLASVTTSSGVLQIQTLHQAALLGTSATDTGLINHLDDSAGGLDATLAPDLVALDSALKRLARQVDADGRAKGLFPGGDSASQIALEQALSTVANVNVAALANTANTSVWGVLAASVGASVPAVRTLVENALETDSISNLVSIVPVPAKTATSGAGDTGGSAGTPPRTDTRPPDDGTGSGTGTGTGTGGGGDTPAPSPSDSSTPKPSDSAPPTAPQPSTDAPTTPPDSVVPPPDTTTSSVPPPEPTTDEPTPAPTTDAPTPTDSPTATAPDTTQASPQGTVATESALGLLVTLGGKSLRGKQIAAKPTTSAKPVGSGVSSGSAKATTTGAPVSGGSATAKASTKAAAASKAPAARTAAISAAKPATVARPAATKAAPAKPAPTRAAPTSAAPLLLPPVFGPTAKPTPAAGGGRSPAPTTLPAPSAMSCPVLGGSGLCARVTVQAHTVVLTSVAAAARK